MIQQLKIALRDLGRNRRRSFFSAFALALGLGLLIFFAAMVNGMVDDSSETTIRLSSGHLQVRAKTYEENVTSLAWEDLVEDPDQIAAQVASLEPVQVATPRLFATGLTTFGKKTTGLSIMGVDPVSQANDPYRQGLINGEFLDEGDREGILIGLPLANKYELEVGDSISMLINTSNGDIDEQVFTVRGIYSTETNVLDKRTVLMPLDKAQAITRTENHASVIYVLLDDRNNAGAVAAALQTSAYQVVTWDELYELVGLMDSFMDAVMVVLSIGLLAMTSVIIVNTLVMSVRDRTREIGILSALGMRGRSIMAKFLAETSILAVGGVIMGIVLGLIGSWAFSINGFYMGDLDMSSAGMIMTDTMYAEVSMRDVVVLSLEAFIITMIAGLIPARMAARLEPVAALRGGKKF